MEISRVINTEEELARSEIRNFINVGLIDVQNNDLYEYDEVFKEMKNHIKSWLQS